MSQISHGHPIFYFVSEVKTVSCIISQQFMSPKSLATVC